MCLPFTQARRLLEEGLLAKLAALPRFSQHYRAPVGCSVPFSHLNITYVSERVVGACRHAA